MKFQLILKLRFYAPSHSTQICHTPISNSLFSITGLSFRYWAAPFEPMRIPVIPLFLLTLTIQMTNFLPRLINVFHHLQYDPFMCNSASYTRPPQPSLNPRPRPRCHFSEWTNICSENIQLALPWQGLSSFSGSVSQGPPIFHKDPWLPMPARAPRLFLCP